VNTLRGKRGGEKSGYKEKNKDVSNQREDLLAVGAQGSRGTRKARRPSGGKESGGEKKKRVLTTINDGSEGVAGCGENKAVATGYYKSFQKGGTMRCAPGHIA